MAALNHVTIIGNVTQSPELRYTPKGTATTELGVAINRQFTSESGERRTETTFLDIVLWGRLAEIAVQYATKGKLVCIEGRLQLDTWEKDGQKRTKLKVVGENLQLLGDSDKKPIQAEPKPQPRQPAQKPHPVQADTDDIPF